MRFNLIEHLKNFGLIQESDWEQHFLVGSKGMPKTPENIIKYVQHLFQTVYGSDDYKAKLPVVRWVVDNVQKLGGPAQIGTTDREKILKVVEWVKTVGSEGNIPKMDLDTAYNTVVAGFEKRNKKETPKETPQENVYEPEIQEIEKNGLAKRVFTIPDASGRIWMEILKSGDFFDTLCHYKKPHGVGCQSIHNGGIVDDYRKPGMLNFTLVGPPKGKPTAPITTILALSIENKKDLREARQVGNKVPGSESYIGYDDIAERMVEFLSSNVGKENILSINGYSSSEWFQWLLQNRIDLLNKLDKSRPDLIENSKETILRKNGGKQWFENRQKDAVEAAQKNPIDFIENIEAFRASQNFKEALDIIMPQLQEIAKKNPELVLSKIDFFLDKLPFDVFNSIFNSIDINSFIKNNVEDFKRLVKKLASNNTKDASKYKDVLNNIINENSHSIIEAFGRKGVGVMKFLDFLSMPKMHEFSKKENGQIYAFRTKTDVAPDGTRTHTRVEFPLDDNTLSVMPQKQRRDFILNNKDYIESFFDGTPEEKKIKFLRYVFMETNLQDVSRTLQKEKEEFINYYNANPSPKTVYPGIMELYAILNAKSGGQAASKTLKNGESVAYVKMDLDDAKNPEYAKKIVAYYYNKSNSDNKIDKRYDALRDYFITLEVSGENENTIFDSLMNNYQPSKIIASKDLTPTDYEKFVNRLLVNFGDKSKIKSAVEELKPQILSSGISGDAVYKNLISKFSEKGYEVEPGDFIEYNGESGYNLQFGKKYNVGYVQDYKGIKNYYVQVFNDSGKLTDWLETSNFKVKEGLFESFLIKKIRKSLIQNAKNKGLI